MGRRASRQDFVQALIAEYQPGTPLGWHRDVPDFEVVVGISLAGTARLRFRPYPWTPEKEVAGVRAGTGTAARQYILRDQARWDWQHHVPPTKELRYSITFRTASDKIQGSRQPRSRARD